MTHPCGVTADEVRATMPPRRPVQHLHVRLCTRVTPHRCSHHLAYTYARSVNSRDPTSEGRTEIKIVQKWHFWPFCHFWSFGSLFPAGFDTQMTILSKKGHFDPSWGCLTTHGHCTLHCTLYSTVYRDHPWWSPRPGMSFSR